MVTFCQRKDLLCHSKRLSLKCSERGIDLSHQTLLLPNTGDYVKRKLIYLDLVELKEKGFTHVVFNVPKSHPKVFIVLGQRFNDLLSLFYYFQGSVLIDVHRSIDRKREIRFPFKSYIPFMPLGHVIIPNDAVSYNISLPNLQKSWQSILVKQTGKNSCPLGNNALIRKIVPWSHENQYFLSNRSFSVHLHIPKTPIDNQHDSTYLQFINPHPDCHYELEYVKLQFLS